MLLGHSPDVVILRLDSAAVNAMQMQRLANLGSDRHEIVIPGRKYVNRSYDLRFGELPDVQFVQGQDSFDFEN